MAHYEARAQERTFQPRRVQVGVMSTRWRGAERYTRYCNVYIVDMVLHTAERVGPAECYAREALAYAMTLAQVNGLPFDPKRDVIADGQSITCGPMQRCPGCEKETGHAWAPTL